MRMMSAARFYEAGNPLRVEDVPLPEPGPGEAVVEVKACGLCGTDLHIAREGTIPTAKVPITLGHEAAGVVASVGSAVEEWRVGDRVAVYPHEPCGDCRLCHSGNEALCPETRVLGLHIDGAFAQYVKIRSDSLLALPEEIPFEHGAILTDAVSTAFHALTQRGRLVPDETLAVFGCGGVGHHVVKLARLFEAGRIFAVDLAQGALNRAEQAGADELVQAGGEEPWRRIRERSGGEGVDLAIECVGKSATVGQALRSVRRGGRLVVVGVGKERVELPPLRVFVGSELTVMGSMGFSRGDAREVIRRATAGQLDLTASVTETLPLDRINEALERLEKRSGDPVRIVVAPQKGG
ncbi:MAG: alcohol dehydrogenase catalytic domain-containing protein [Thermoanaerobaculia bacterium]